MLVIQEVLGNCKSDPDWQAELCGMQVDYLVLDQHDAQKNSCRKNTQSGLALGISLSRDVMLADGDVLLFDALKKRAVVVRITLRKVMIIDLNSQLTLQPDGLMKLGFELGHALGNQHWKAVLKKSQVYIPVTVAERVMESVIRTHGFNGLHYSFVGGESVLPHLSSSEARLLFGGAEETDMHVEVTHNKTNYGDGHDHH